MKYFLVLSAVLLAASAMPTELGREAEAAAFNSTTRRPLGLTGFASTGNGVRGGQGGAVWTVWDAWAFRDAISGNSARIIYVRGRIDLTVLFTASPGVRLVVGNWKSILGGDRNAEIFGGGVVIYYGEQVIIHNIKFHNALSYAPGERPNGQGGIISQVPGAFSAVDAVDIEGSQYVWVDHCNFADDPWVATTVPESQRRHDGLIDIKAGANWISISNNIFRNHNLAMLVGHNDNNAAQDIGRLKVSYYGNWFQGTVQRNPRVRYGEVHIFNNLYTDIIDYGIGIGAGALIYAERNVFINTRRAWGFAAGTPNPLGFLLSIDNWLLNSAHDSGISSNGIRWNPSQYYRYSPLATADVERSARTFAGVI